LQFADLTTSYFYREVSMKQRLVVVVGVTVLVCSSVLVAQGPAPHAADLLIGMWKQNMEKSTYDPGPAPAKGSGAVRQYAAGDDGAIVAITININPQGLPSLGAISAANYDGREYAQHTLATLASSLGSHVGPKIDRTISYTSTDPYTVEIVQKQDGDIVSRSTRTISRDGKTLTERFTNAQGQRVTNVLVFEKQ
jgi:hypothetical protein